MIVFKKSRAFAFVKPEALGRMVLPLASVLIPTGFLLPSTPRCSHHHHAAWPVLMSEATTTASKALYS